MFNENAFKGKVKACGFTLEQIANFIGINAATLFRKMSGETEFKRNEIEIIRQKLNLTIQELKDIFFAE